jgi:hypothetical protein
MSRLPGYAGNGRRAPFPASTPPEVNHAVLTGRLSAEPQEGRSPLGERVTLLRIEFPVADPGDREALWTWASCLVEVPRDRARRDVEELHGGASVLAAGQLSERWVIEEGHTSRRGVIVATLVKAGPPERPGDLFVIGGGR